MSREAASRQERRFLAVWDSRKVLIDVGASVAIQLASRRRVPRLHEREQAKRG